MDAAEFDRFVEEYDQDHRRNIAITGEGPEYFAEYKIRALASFVKQDANRDRVLDFGSGIGNSIPYFRQYFPDSALTAADVSRRSLDLAETRFPGLAQSLLIQGDRIPADDASFDIAFSACVFHHIPEAEHLGWLRELRRVVRPGGTLAIFEHNPLNPLTVRAVNTCPFDVNAKLIRAGALADRFRRAGWSGLATRYHIFFPHALAALRPIEKHLVSVPLGAQYSVSATR